MSEEETLMMKIARDTLENYISYLRCSLELILGRTKEILYIDCEGELGKGIHERRTNISMGGPSCAGVSATVMVSRQTAALGRPD